MKILTGICAFILVVFTTVWAVGNFPQPIPLDIDEREWVAEQVEAREARLAEYRSKQVREYTLDGTPFWIVDHEAVWERPEWLGKDGRVQITVADRREIAGMTPAPVVRWLPTEVSTVAEYNSALVAVKAGLIFVPAFGLVGGLIFGLAGRLIGGLRPVPIVGLCFGLISLLVFGLTGWLQHGLGFGLGFGLAGGLLMVMVFVVTYIAVYGLTQWLQTRRARVRSA